MALNYSQLSMLPALVSEDSLVNRYVVDDDDACNDVEGSSRSWHSSLKEASDDQNFNGSLESLSTDNIADLMPSDPFEMNIHASITVLSGLIEELGHELGGYMRDNTSGFSSEDRGFPDSVPMNRIVDMESGLFDFFGWRGEEKVDASDDLEGVPHDGLTFALSYLGLKDLLSVERVCRSLYLDVQGNPLLWMNLNIDRPLNERITDNILLQLASRAQGDLQCLSIVACPKITDDGLRLILETNKRLTKLCVAGCRRISIGCIVNSIKAYNSNGGGIKKLRIGGISNVKQEHFDELKLLLGVDKKKHDESCEKRHLYYRGNFYLPDDDDRAIDIEKCPRCEELKLVYDCPAEGCNMSSQEGCRACSLCIARCAQCGRCIDKTEYVETFCLQLQCSDCYKQMHRYQDKIEPYRVPLGLKHNALRG